MEVLIQSKRAKNTGETNLNSL